jgi:hypothetical protein
MTICMTDPTDSEALRESRADPQAFVLIFERHFDPVNRFLRRRFAPDGELREPASWLLIQAVVTRRGAAHNCCAAVIGEPTIFCEF